MLKNKWVAIGLVVVALAIIGFYTVPKMLQRARTKARPVSAGVPVSTPKEAAVAIPPAAPPVRGVSRAAVAPSIPATRQQEWLKAYAAAGRDTSRSPFQRRYEGLGKVFIRSRPSGAEIYINGIKMPKPTDWLMPVSFPAGRYRLEIRKEGYEPYVTELVVPKSLVDFEEITTVNAALEKLPEEGIHQAHRELLRSLGKPPVRVTMIMYGGASSTAVIAYRILVEDEIKTEKRAVLEGDELVVPASLAQSEEDKEPSHRIKIVKILPECVIIRNMLINVDYEFPLQSGWKPVEELAQK